MVRFACTAEEKTTPVAKRTTYQIKGALYLFTKNFPWCDFQCHYVKCQGITNRNVSI